MKMLWMKKFEILSERGRPPYIRSSRDRSTAFVQQVLSKVTMQPVTRMFASLCLLTLVLGNSYHSSAKLRRDGVLNLYPFPRVGRASHRTWQVPVNDIYFDYEPAVKRQLYAFPRVGRGEPLQERPEGPLAIRRTDSPGMWFGPRLGRSLKLDEDELPMENSNVERSEPEQMEPVPDNRKKRQTHSV